MGWRQKAELPNAGVTHEELQDTIAKAKEASRELEKLLKDTKREREQITGVRAAMRREARGR